MQTRFKYGKTSIELNVPENADMLKAKEPVFCINIEKFRTELETFLPKETTCYSNVAIVVSDKTRLCGYPVYLPWLVESLVSRGTRNSNISFYIAYGTHQKQSEPESLESYGDVYKKYTFIHHNSKDKQAFIELGQTKRGTPIKIRKDILRSSLIITFGAISHHYFAGFGGGRKLIFPGLAEQDAVYKNHSYFLDIETKHLAPGCHPGKLNDNPIAEDLKEIDDKLPVKISIHGILNRQGKVCQLHIGNTYKDFLDACQEHDNYYRAKEGKLYNLVIASAGGYPKDVNFIQSHKAIHNAAAFVKDGGKLVVFCECVDGIGSETFLKYIQAESFNHAFNQLKQNYEGNGGTALAMMMKTKRINIGLVTNLNAEACMSLKVEILKPGDVQDIVNKENGSIAVIENASLLVM
ncbi:MAG: nickel-dependent lactate racemase [Bacteroidales bacterium]|nr:nickel-dependent lactate racemase [Bacteroidales bacterium]MBN2818291.1 nickel-dependent lactate racemase [Bacteroidales bacterium]